MNSGDKDENISNHKRFVGSLHSMRNHGIGCNRQMAVYQNKHKKKKSQHLRFNGKTIIFADISIFSEKYDCIKIWLAIGNFTDPLVCLLYQK